MKIDDDLNLVIDYDGLKIHHTPMSRSAFELHYRPLTWTKGVLFRQGSKEAFMNGPMTARLVLLDEARRMAEENETEDQGKAILNEISRTTLVLVPGPVPLDTAVNEGRLDAETRDEILSVLVFFTCVYWTIPRSARRDVSVMMGEVMGFTLTSLNCEAYADSSGTSTATGTADRGSSIPS